MIGLNQNVIWSVLELIQLLWKYTTTNAVTLNRRLETQGFMGTQLVVDFPPLIKGLLCIGQRHEAFAVEHFCFQRAVEPFVLAVGLRVTRTAPAQLDA
ncbi:hypothetical protein D3C80_1825690 [compost metagenome]